MSSAMVRWQLLVISLYNLLNVDCLTNIEIRAVVFRNDAGKRQDGKCCDPFCFNECDSRLTFCLDEVGNTNKTGERCSLQKKISEEYRDQNTVYFSNEIISAQLENWEGSIAFEVIIIDEDLQFNDVIDKMYTELLVPIPDETNKKIWHSKTIHGQRASNPTSLEIQFAIYCVAGWHGDKCQLLRRSTDNQAVLTSSTTEQVTVSVHAHNQAVLTSSTTEQVTVSVSTVLSQPPLNNIQIGIISGVLSLVVISVIVVTVLCYRKHAETRSANTEPASRQADAITSQHPIGQLDYPRQVENKYEELGEDINLKSIG